MTLKGIEILFQDYMSMLVNFKRIVKFQMYPLHVSVKYVCMKP